MKTKEQLLKELGFSDELLEKMEERNDLFNFTSTDQPNFNCIQIENDDFSEMIIENVDELFMAAYFTK
ncbi:hypothetical protein [Flavobacterium mekongense]|uniref:hypothetical protein n=1 Tax=Flavobacterium mekongense TaxID=3379707 RepID=UPI00399980A3